VKKLIFHCFMSCFCCCCGGGGGGGGWVGVHACVYVCGARLDAVGKKKVLTLFRLKLRLPGHSADSHLLYWLRWPGPCLLLGGGGGLAGIISLLKYKLYV
jgi:hypothetical protein